MVVKRDLWNKLGSTKLSIVVLVLLVVNLTVGYVMLNGNESIFTALNNLGLIEWTRTYGLTFPAYTVWLFGFMIILVILTLNTFVCTTNRVVSLIRYRHTFTSRIRLLLRFSVHIMHYALIIILAGYLVSYLFACTCPSLILIPGQVVPVPDTDIKAGLESVNVKFYEGNRLIFLKDRAYDVCACVKLFSDGKTAIKKVGLNTPFRYRGLSFHLKDFGPKYGKGLKTRPFINLIVKNDPGVKLYFAGTSLFVVGLVMYLYQWVLLKIR